MKIYNHGWEALGFDSYSDFLNSIFWKEKREWIIKCKGSKCERCNSIKNLVVHHIHYETLGNESSKDVLVLCKECHNKEHLKEGDKNDSSRQI